MISREPNKANPGIRIHNLVERNQADVGHFFMQLLKGGLGKWEQRVVALLCRSNAYRNNNLQKLLELANDVKIAHKAQIDFFEKYTGELFLPGAAKMEKEESKYLDMHIIPNVTRLINRRDSK